jgi:hypothetical protein
MARSRLSLPAYGSFLWALLAASSAAEIEVPGQYPTIQLALDAAAPGETIRVHGGTYEPIVITKPVRIIGEGRTQITNEVLTWGTQPHNVTLAGPGAGTVQLVSLSLVGVTSGFFQSHQGSRVAGGGFAELHLQECILAPPAWTSLTGIGFGAPGIAVNIPYVLLSHTAVTGGTNGTDYSIGLPAFNGHPGVKNVNGAVSVLDSVVTGGQGTGANFPPGIVPPGGCPTDLLPGKGGAGLHVREAYVAGSLVKGGGGAHIYEVFAYKGQQAEGPPHDARTVVEFQNTLTDAGVPQPGSNWTLTWTSASPFAGILVSSRPVKPFYYEGVGWFFSDLSEIHVLESVEGGPLPHSATLTLPSNPAIVGVEFVTQLWDPLDGLGRPIVRVVVP